MSQSASYYSITLSHFTQIQESVVIFQYEKENAVTLHESHEGLKYILTKIFSSRPDAIRELFNPELYLGILPNFEDEHADIDAFLNNPPLYYLTPKNINLIHSVLTTITDYDLSKEYSAREFNENGVYPEVWNNSSDPNTSFNLNHLLEDFDNLKKFISKAVAQNNYVIVSIG